MFGRKHLSILCSFDYRRRFYIPLPSFLSLSLFFCLSLPFFSLSLSLDKRQALGSRSEDEVKTCRKRMGKAFRVA